MHANQKYKSCMKALTLAFFFTLVVTACSSMQSQMPGYIGNADSAVGNAQAANAAELAPAELETAEGKLYWAKAYHQFSGNQDTDDPQVNLKQDSLFLAEEATIDAKVAFAAAKYAQLNNRVDSLQGEISQLHRTLEQNQSNQ